MENLEQALTALRQENTLLLGLMTGGYAYFLHHFMLGHQSQEGLTAEACEKVVVDGIKRILSSQNRFQCEYLSEIEAILTRMTTVMSLEPYLQEITAIDEINPEEGSP
jgi:hypothetical protein